MEAELERRWRAGTSPFDGVTLSPVDMLPLPRLRRALLAVIGCLEKETPQSRLFQSHDWHQHDGYITAAEPTSWAEVKSWCISDDELYSHRTGDYYVSVGIFPEDWHFYFRIYLDEELDQGERVGDFDLTGRPELIGHVQKAFQDTGITDLGCESAKAYFDRRYAG